MVTYWSVPSAKVIRYNIISPKAQTDGFRLLVWHARILIFVLTLPRHSSLFWKKRREERPFVRDSRIPKIDREYKITAEKSSCGWGWADSTPPANQITEKPIKNSISGKLKNKWQRKESRMFTNSPSILFIVPNRYQWNWNVETSSIFLTSNQRSSWFFWSQVKIAS